MLLLMLAPALVVTLVYLGARLWVSRKQTINRKAIGTGFGAACAAFCAYDLYLYIAFLNSDRSMAMPGGLAELVMVGPIVWLAALAVGWSGGFLFYSARARREDGARRAFGTGTRIGTAVAITIVVLAVAYAGKRTYSGVLWHRATSAQTAEELDVLYDRFGVRYDRAVLVAIADNRSSSMELLQKLSTNNHWQVRTVVARNPNTEPEVLRRMYEDHSARTSLAMNPNTPVDVLERLLHDSDRMVRYNLAGNRSVNKSMLSVLAKDSGKDVSRRALTQQVGRAYRKRRGCLDGPMPIPVRHEGPLPALDEVLEAHRRQTGLDYQVCPDGYDYRLDNAEVRPEHRACIAERVRDRQHQAWNKAKRTGLSFVGPRRVLRLAHTKRARSYEVFGSLNPQFAAAGNRAAATEAVKRLRAFKAQYARALAAWTAGDRRARFPEGTWWMRVCHGALCGPGP